MITHTFHSQPHIESSNVTVHIVWEGEWSTLYTPARTVLCCPISNCCRPNADGCIFQCCLCMSEMCVCKNETCKQTILRRRIRTPTIFQYVYITTRCVTKSFCMADCPQLIHRCVSTRESQQLTNTTAPYVVTHLCTCKWLVASKSLLKPVGWAWFVMNCFGCWIWMTIPSEVLTSCFQSIQYFERKSSESVWVVLKLRLRNRTHVFGSPFLCGRFLLSLWTCTHTHHHAVRWHLRVFTFKCVCIC